MKALELSRGRADTAPAEYVPVIIIGGGQAGLSAGYHLARRGIAFLILDANARVGDSWRARWDSLRLFTPARFDGLDGMPFPAPAGSFPTKDQMADYLAAYVRRFDLPIRSGVRVDSLSRRDGRYRLTAGDRVFEADQVVVAMANYQKPSVPDFARLLDPSIVQIKAAAYRNPAQLRDGPVLIAGAGNSGAEIAIELATSRKVWLAGRDVGEIPFRMESFWGRHVQSRLVLGLVFHHLLTVDTPMGRKARVSHRATPLIRTRRTDLAVAGVEGAPRLAGVEGGRPRLEDGRVLEVPNLIWCTGFQPDFSWIGLDVFRGDGEPRHHRGVVKTEPGLYFLGLHFLYAMSSTMIHGVGRDARYIAERIQEALPHAADRISQDGHQGRHLSA
jgi:putative flavoprotein involved in K+ transport